VDGRTGHEPHELDAPHRGHRRAVRRAAGRADRDLPLRLGRGGMGARAAGLGQPQRDPDRHRPGPRVLRRRIGAQRGPGRLLDGGLARFGKSYVGEPDALAEELAQDAAVARPTRCSHRAQPARRRLQHASARLDRRDVGPAIGWERTTAVG
jgi:hypothetical protein